MPMSRSDPSPPSARLQDHFASLADPRRRKVTYPLINILAIAVCAVVAGADDFVSIALWGRERRDWLSKFLDLSAGIPSHDRFNAIFRALDPGAFEKCLLGWIAALHEATAGQVVAYPFTAVGSGAGRIGRLSRRHERHPADPPGAVGEDAARCACGHHRARACVGGAHRRPGSPPGSGLVQLLQPPLHRPAPRQAPPPAAPHRQETRRPARPPTPLPRVGPPRATRRHRGLHAIGLPRLRPTPAR
jgi:hypothetical protein